MPEAAEEEAWSPDWAQHVVGRWNKRRFDRATGEVEAQIVRMVCNQCGATYQVKCMSGAVRTWVTKFARVHFHGNPLDPAHVKRMADARVEARAEKQRKG